MSSEEERRERGGAGCRLFRPLSSLVRRRERCYFPKNKKEEKEKKRISHDPALF